MKILVLNCGSSSIKYKLFDMDKNFVMAQGGIEKIGLLGSFLKLTAPNGCVVMPVSDLVPGGTYRYSFWHKGEGSVNADMALY
ncbi:MAG: hypothetical protein IIX29_08560, partial [Bacteroidales bacterium]|nr:hypothetical protein [Bacteroidales bacterium]